MKGDDGLLLKCFVLSQLVKEGILASEEADEVLRRLINKEADASNDKAA